MRSSPSPPTGDVTFVFTDIEGSTAIWDQTPDAMTDALAEHDRRIRSIVDRHDGYVFSTAGDSFAAAFQTAAEAVDAPLDVQLALQEPAASLTLKVREVIGLVGEHRLATLSGAGGAGMTRLAMRVAEELLADFPDGLRVAEPGAVRDAELLVEEIAQRFAVTEEVGTPLVRSVAEYIGSQTMLLVLDNCEQIITETAGLCRDLLTSCPNLRVLATSRERLGVAGEALYRVPSLSLPDENATVEEAYRHDAVRLFAERSQLASSEFAVTADNVSAVVSICRNLDGISLALELAARRSPSIASQQASTEHPSSTPTGFTRLPGRHSPPGSARSARSTIRRSSASAPPSARPSAAESARRTSTARRSAPSPRHRGPARRAVRRCTRGRRDTAPG